MDFSKPKNLIILIISLLIIFALSINASVSWFIHSSKEDFTNDVTVLKFDFKTNNVLKYDVTLRFNTASSSNYPNEIMAPGVRGYHQFQFTNNGDVPVKYTVTIDMNNSVYPENMEFYSDNSFSSNSIISGSTVWQDTTIAKGGTSTPTVGFLWRFEDNSDANAADASFNQNNDVVILTFVITAYQAI